jgi:hypothetical protein
MARFHVRNQHGELEVGTFAELRTLYLRQFISDEDEIRRDGSEQWVKAGLMPDLRLAKPRPYLHGNEFGWLAVAIAVGTLIMVFLMRK